MNEINPQADRKENPDPYVIEGCFRVREGSNAQQFAQFLYNSFQEKQTQYQLSASKEVKLEEIDSAVQKELVERMLQTFAVEHAVKFHVKIHGIFAIDDESNLSAQATDELWYHGTDPARGTSIISGGFTVPEERKTDANPWYGIGVPLAKNFSKAQMYYGDTYSSRERRSGPLFIVVPEAKVVFEALSPTWGNTINSGEYRGQDWHETPYDAIRAIPRGKKNSQGELAHEGAVNFEEMTIRDPAHAKIKYVVWAELIPNSDPEYDQFSNPVELASRSDYISRLIEQAIAPQSRSEIKSDELVSSVIEAPEGVRVVDSLDFHPISGSKMECVLTGDGVQLSPGEAVMIRVPSPGRDDVLTNIVLKHYKHPSGWYPGRTPRRWTGIKENEIRDLHSSSPSIFRRSTGEYFTLDPDISHLVDKGGGFYNERDTHPAKTRVRVHDRKAGQWIDLGTKIGEVRPVYEPEEERLHDLPRIEVDAVLLVSAGSDQKAVVNISEVQLLTRPEKLSGNFVEHLWTPGIDFNQNQGYYPRDSQTGMRTWGYPNSVQVGEMRPQPFQTKTADFQDGVSLENHRLHIDLEPGKVLEYVEIACGDTVFGASMQQNKSGWGQLEVEIVTTQGRKIPVISKESVPPYGILSGAPYTETVIQAGDKITINSVQHPSWIMGVRLNYREGGIDVTV